MSKSTWQFSRNTLQWMIWGSIGGIMMAGGAAILEIRGAEVFEVPLLPVIVFGLLDYWTGSNVTGADFSATGCLRRILLYFLFLPSAFVIQALHAEFFVSATVAFFVGLLTGFLFDYLLNGVFQAGYSDYE